MAIIERVALKRGSTVLIYSYQLENICHRYMTMHMQEDKTTSDQLSHADWLNEHRSAEDQYHHAESQNFRHSQDPELLWRFGRACHCIYSYSTVATKEVKAAAIQDGLRAVEIAVQINPGNANVFVVSSIN